MSLPPISNPTFPLERTQTPPAEESRFGWVLHAYAAFVIAVVAPMYGRLQERTMFLASLETITVIAFVVLWSLVAPAAVLMVVAGFRWHGPRAGANAMLSVIGVSCMLALLGISKAVVYPYSKGEIGWLLGWLTIAFSIAGGQLAAAAYRRWSWLRSLLSVAAFASLMCPVPLIWTYVRESARPVVTAELTVRNPIPVVMVVFDCLSGISLMDQNRQIDADRYPNLAELSGTSNWYRNCTSVHPRTIRAVPAIMAGKLYPFGETPPNLFTYLEATQEYELTAFEPFTRLCPRDRFRDRVPPDLWTQWASVAYTVGTVFLSDLKPVAFPLDTPRVPRIWFGLNNSDGTDTRQLQGLIQYGWDSQRDQQFQHYLKCLRETDRPTFWFGHFALPHFPWNYLPSGRAYRDDHGMRQEWGTEGQAMENWADDEVVVLQAHQQHVLQTGYADLLIGRLIDRLRQAELFDSCLLVVVADHGISFRKGMSGRAPTEKSLAEIMSVPLFIKLPGQRTGDVIDLNVETTDILPTILDVIQLDPQTPLHGQSLIDSDFRERPTKRFEDDHRVFEIDGSFDAKYNVLAEQIALFGTGEDPLRIFRIGPHSELVGRKLDELRLGGKSTLRIGPVNFDADVIYADGQPVPAHLEGKVAPPLAPRNPVRIAVAVNDVVWGTTQTYQVKYLKDYWRVMLPELAFKNGTNRIRIFQIEDSASGPVLAECRIGSREIGPKLPFE
jgi:hypothetical protein